jgi:hypothetical protein
MTFWCALPTTTVRIVLLIAIASADALSGQSHSHVARPPTPRSPHSGANMMIDDSLFQHVPLDTREPTACSPADPGTDWRGVMLRAPSQVMLPDQRTQHSALIVPLCGLYFVDAGSVLGRPTPKMLVVTDEKSGQVYRGEIIKRDPNPQIPPPPSPPLDPALFANLAFQGYFNVNVASYVALPLRPARYRVKIEYSGHQSNEVSIAVVQRP